MSGPLPVTVVGAGRGALTKLFKGWAIDVGFPDGFAVGVLVVGKYTFGIAFRSDAPVSHGGY